MAILDLLKRSKSAAEIRAAITEADIEHDDAAAAVDKLRDSRAELLLTGDDPALDRLDAQLTAEFRRLDRADAVLAALRVKLDEAAEREVAAHRNALYERGIKHQTRAVELLTKYGEHAAAIQVLLAELMNTTAEIAASNGALSAAGDTRSIDQPERVMQTAGVTAGRLFDRVKLPDATDAYASVWPISDPERRMQVATGRDHTAA